MTTVTRSRITYRVYVYEQSFKGGRWFIGEGEDRVEAEAVRDAHAKRAGWLISEYRIEPELKKEN